MATEFNTQVGNGEYRLHFKTDNREYYMLMQSTARRCVDGSHMTNADHFSAMSNEEQQNFVRSFWEIEDFADWLEQSQKGE